MMRAVLILLAMLVVGSRAAGQRTALPAKLESYFNSAGAISAEQRRQLLAGQPITKLLDADAIEEVAVLGAIWIAAPTRRYVEAVMNIESFESGGGFKVTSRISAPPDSTTSRRCGFPTTTSTISEAAVLVTARSSWGSRRSDDSGARSTGKPQLLVMLRMPSCGSWPLNT